MLDYLTEAQAFTLVGFLGGLALGLAARLGRFCTLGAIEDLLYGNDDRRLRMWIIAIGTAVVAAHLAIGTGHILPEQTAYVSQAWNPLATIVGGLVFGYGMALSGNCGYGALARLGGGDLRSLVIVAVMGISAYVVMSGPLAHLRIALFPVESADTPQSISAWLAATTGISAWIAGTVIGAALLAGAFAGQRTPLTARHIFWGAVVGLAVVSGWIGTQWVVTYGFSAQIPRTHTFSAPVGETLIYLMTASGGSTSFGVGSVAGVLAGAWAGSGLRGEFRWEACDDSRELKRQMIGASLMGGGAVIAVGCSIGQGVSAFSLLAASAPLTLVMIFIGATIGLRQLIVGYSTGGSSLH